MNPLKPTIAILAGGRSRRMGRDKARLPLGTGSLLERVLAAAEPLDAHRMLVAGDEREYADLGLPIHADLLPGAGPLAGLYTALRQAPTSPLLLLACDMPFLSADLLRFLLDRIGDHQALVPRSDDGLQPLCAVYAASCLPAIERALDRGERRLVAFYPDIDLLVLKTEEWRPHAPHNFPFTNLNTPEDLQRARQLLDLETTED